MNSSNKNHLSVLFNKETLVQFAKCVVQGLATFVLDAGLLYVITEAGLHYLLSSAIAYIIVLCVHFYSTKKFIFKTCSRPLHQEMALYFGIALVSLALTELLMYLFTDGFGIYYIFSKFLSTGVVLVWSFSARKFWLYK